MRLYRITKTEKRATDISGMGAFKEGGRWNSKGTYMLYTSENSSLAYLENLVYFDLDNAPGHLYIIGIDFTASSSLIFTLPESSYSKNWLDKGNQENKLMGDQLMFNREYMAVKVRSAVNPFEYNFLLNPLFPGYHDLIKINSVKKLNIDPRLKKHQGIV
jgi:RES domain-containing protein